MASRIDAGGRYQQSGDQASGQEVAGGWLRGRYWSVTVVLAVALAACSPDHGQTVSPPLIAITGIYENAVYDSVAIPIISIDHGTYAATLDGQPYTPGTPIRTAGAHTLSVSARDGSATSAKDVHFTINSASPGTGAGVLIVRMLNLGANDAGGGGDAIVITDSTDRGQTHVMIDAGPSGANGSDPGFAARTLASLHIDTLALLILTHAHEDHYGGMSPVLSAEHVRRFVYNGQLRSLSSYNAVISQARSVADSIITPLALRSYDLDSTAAPAHLTLLPPLTTWLNTDTDDGDELNNGSVGARIDLGSFSMLFTGDAEVEANNHWMSSYPTLVNHVTVLKVGHHGANNAIFDNGLSGTSTWLATVSPKVSIISADGTTHPRIAALNRILAQVGNQTWCTNVHGTITLRITRDGSYTTSVEKNAGQNCVPGSGATT